MQYQPRSYQAYTTERIVSDTHVGPFLDMGLGKTVSTLTAIDQLIYDYFEVSSVLIVAPLKVAETVWSGEIEKWAHLNHLTYSKILGTEKQRREALKKKAHVYIINRDNIAWLVAYLGGAFPFDMLVIDELSSFKNPKSNRFKALKMIQPKVKRVVGLTGTPAPNGLIDLWAQLYLLDRGERLEKTVTRFRDKYFRAGKRNGHIVYKYDILEGKEAEILEKISDICFSMKSEDYLDMPKRVDTLKIIQFPETLKKRYSDFEEQLILSLPDDEHISVANAAALTNKLRQFANGAVYDSEHEYHVVHDEKLQALDEEIEAANGANVLIFYQYKSDLARILKRYKGAVFLKGKKEIDDWNAGKINKLVTHAASAGHGLNLQFGGHITLWFGVDWNLEYYNQGVKRVDRPGQTHTVTNSRLIVQGTIDEDIIAALDSKDGVEQAALNAIKARIEKYKKKLAKTA